MKRRVKLPEVEHDLTMYYSSYVTCPHCHKLGAISTGESGVYQCANCQKFFRVTEKLKDGQPCIPEGSPRSNPVPESSLF
jgi:ribosomal protein L37AE/L43A